MSLEEYIVGEIGEEKEKSYWENCVERFAKAALGGLLYPHLIPTSLRLIVTQTDYDKRIDRIPGCIGGLVTSVPMAFYGSLFWIQCAERYDQPGIFVIPLATNALSGLYELHRRRKSGSPEQAAA